MANGAGYTIDHRHRQQVAHLASQAGQRRAGQHDYVGTILCHGALS